MGLKQPYAVPDMAKQNIFTFKDAIVLREITPTLVEELLVKRHELFLEAEAVVKTEPVAEVEELMAWGVLNDEPMGIYIGEKLAMLTNQTISHPVALAVAQYLSHQRDIPASRVARCK